MENIQRIKKLKKDRDQALQLLEQGVFDDFLFIKCLLKLDKALRRGDVVDETKVQNVVIIENKRVYVNAFLKHYMQFDVDMLRAQAVTIENELLRVGISQIIESAYNTRNKQPETAASKPIEVTEHYKPKRGKQQRTIKLNKAIKKGKLYKQARERDRCIFIHNLKGRRSTLINETDECNCCKMTTSSLWWYSSVNVVVCSMCKNKIMSGRLPDRMIIKIKTK